MTNHPNRSRHILVGHERRAFPGDSVYVLDRAATSDQDHRFAAGTEYVPLSAGYDNQLDTEYQTAMIGGKKITFHR